MSTILPVLTLSGTQQLEVSPIGTGDLLTIAIWCGVLAVTTVLSRPAIQSWLLPPPRVRAVTWTGWEIIACAYLYLLFWTSISFAVLQATGFYDSVVGPAEDPTTFRSRQIL